MANFQCLSPFPVLLFSKTLKIIPTENRLITILFLQMTKVDILKQRLKSDFKY